MLQGMVYDAPLSNNTRRNEYKMQKHLDHGLKNYMSCHVEISEDEDPKVVIGISMVDHANAVRVLTGVKTDCCGQVINTKP